MTTNPDFTIRIDLNSDLNHIKVLEGDTVKKISNFFVDTSADHLAMGLLPPVVKSVSPGLEFPGRKEYIVLVERKPEMITVFASTGKAFEIPVPWQHYFFRFIKSPLFDLQVQTIGVFFSQTKLETVDHVFYKPFLPNIFDDNMTTPDPGQINVEYIKDPKLAIPLGNVCMNYLKLKECKASEFTELFDQFYEQFWHSSSFNSDIEPLMKSFSRRYFKQATKSPATLFAKLASIKFEDILSDAVFKALKPGFTFAAYIKEILALSGDQLFDFAKLFEQSLDAGKIINAYEDQANKRAAISARAFKTKAKAAKPLIDEGSIYTTTITNTNTARINWDKDSYISREAMEKIIGSTKLTWTELTEPAKPETVEPHDDFISVEDYYMEEGEKF